MTNQEISDAAVEAAANAPTHTDWERARSKRDNAARLTVRALLDGKTDTAMQHAMEYDAQDDLMWSISKILDAPLEASK